MLSCSSIVTLLASTVNVTTYKRYHIPSFAVNETPVRAAWEARAKA